MTQEEKLIKFLAAMVPYGLKCDVFGIDNTLVSVEGSYCKFKDPVYMGTSEECKRCHVQFVQPYLRKMDDISVPERESYSKIPHYTALSSWMTVPSVDRLDWLRSHFVDYLGFIDRGKALEAPKGMYGSVENFTDKMKGE